MEIAGLSHYQSQIANLLWNCKTQEQVDFVLYRLGTDALVVYEMLIATHFDTRDDTKVAKRVLRKFTIKGNKNGNA